MQSKSAEVMKGVAHAVAAAADEEMARLRSLDPSQRSALIESACRAAMAIERSRLAAGLPPSEPAPWPPSTWEYLRKWAASVRE
jgi:hypothetical protein